MFHLDITNETGDTITLTQNGRYSVVDIGGLNPPSAIINTSIVSTNDGAYFNSARLDIRNIVITLAIHGQIEKNRIALYKYFKTKKQCKIHYSNESRDVVIFGYVETIDNNFFVQSQMVQISILCLQPYFQSAAEIVTDISQILALFEFPFDLDEAGEEFSVIDKTLSQSIINNGDVETGIIIELSVVGHVVNPIVYNSDTMERFGLKITLESGDVIRINTNQGEKKVELIRGGKTTNAINYITPDSSWFTLATGDNIFTYTCETGDEFLNVKFIHSDKYEGV